MKMKAGSILGWTGSFLVLVAVIIFIGPKRIATASARPAFPADQAKIEWKKAKDKFLTEVKKLSQSPTLSEQEKELIRNIEQSWKGYDVSFQKYVLASTREYLVFLTVWLGILTGVVAVGGGILILRRRPKSPYGKISGILNGTSNEELVRQAQEIQKALIELKSLMAQVAPPPVETQVEPKTEPSKE